jgi:hypothetical protein
MVLIGYGEANLITEKINDHQVQSQQQLENRVPPTIKMQLIREFGLSVDSYIQRIIRIVKAEQILKIKSQSITDLYIEMLETTPQPLLPSSSTSSHSYDTSSMPTTTSAHSWHGTRSSRPNDS